MSTVTPRDLKLLDALRSAIFFFANLLVVVAVSSKYYDANQMFTPVLFTLLTGAIGYWYDEITTRLTWELYFKADEEELSDSLLMSINQVVRDSYEACYEDDSLISGLRKDIKQNAKELEAQGGWIRDDIKRGDNPDCDDLAVLGEELVKAIYERAHRHGQVRHEFEEDLAIGLTTTFAEKVLTRSDVRNVLRGSNTNKGSLKNLSTQVVLDKEYVKTIINGITGIASYGFMPVISGVMNSLAGSIEADIKLLQTEQLLSSKLALRTGSGCNYGVPTIFNLYTMVYTKTVGTTILGANFKTTKGGLCYRYKEFEIANGTSKQYLRDLCNKITKEETTIKYGRPALAQRVWRKVKAGWKWVVFLPSESYIS